MIWLEGTDLNRRPSGYEPDEHSRLLYPPTFFIIPRWTTLCSGIGGGVHMDKLTNIRVPDKTGHYLDTGSIQSGRDLQ